MAPRRRRRARLSDIREIGALAARQELLLDGVTQATARHWFSSPVTTRGVGVFSYTGATTSTAPLIGEPLDFFVPLLATVDDRDGVRVSIVGEKERVVLRVHNQGAVIPAERLPQVFEAFRSGDSNSRRLGLGLYIVQEIVRAHGGKVEARSTAADGTSFTVTLPRCAPTHAPRIRAAPNPEATERR